MDETERKRFEWRRHNISLAGIQAACLTYDDMLLFFESQIEAIKNLLLSAHMRRAQRFLTEPSGTTSPHRGIRAWKWRSTAASPPGTEIASDCPSAAPNSTK